MERYLGKDDTLQMNDGGRYVITEVIGRGSSCAVYRAEHYKDGIQTEHLLKEYNPLLLDLWRLEDGSLRPSDADRNAFEVGMLRFQAGYEKQLSIRRISELRNSTSNVQAVFDANGTRYIDMTLFTGSTYSKVQEKSLHELCKRMKAVTQVIGYYHKAGFLHLDIKPDNIFTLPETCELVMLFDFDSVTEKTAVQTGSILSCTKAWAAPEQIAPAQRKHICEATDLYAIGEMMFYQIFGRHSATEERRSFFEYQFDTEADIFKNTDSKVFPLLSELLHHTVTTAVSNRYTSADELVAALDELIKLSDPKKPHLVSTRVVPEGFFIGRDHELQQIHEILTEENTLFLCGMGGIGKSELARNYVNRHLRDYDTVFFTTYMSSWMTLLTDDYNVQIANYHSYEGEKPEDYFARKLRKLKDLCNERTLFVIDNVDEDEYDESENECFRQIMELPCRFLFTSRLHEWNQPMLEIGVLTDRNDLVTLFDQWCHIKDDEQRNAVNEIIDYVDCHTLTLELIAKQTTAGFTTPAKMLSKLQEHGMHDSGKEKVKSDKDLTVTKKTAFEHICDLFDMAELTDGEKYVMANMALIPSMGVDAHLFMDWCELEDADAINSLIARGWIDRDGDMIKLHPIIREVAQQYGYGFNLGDTVMLKNATVYLTEQFLSFSPTEKGYYADFAVEMATVLMVANLRTNKVGVFLGDVSCQYKDYRNPGIIIKYMERARDIFSGLYGDEHRDTAKFLDNLGALYLEKGNLDTALQYCEQALSIRRKLYGDENPDTAESLNSLGLLYYEKGDLDTALQYWKQALTVRRTLFGDEHPQTAQSLLNLGVLYSAKGELAKALQYTEQALSVFRNHFGDEHPHAALVFENLGLRYWNKGDLDTALQCCEQVLSVRRTLYGDEHPQTAQSLLNLGFLYSAKGELAKALQYTEQALSVFRNHFGDEHPHTAAALNNLGLRYEENGDFDTALLYCEQALTVRRKLFGDEHPDTAQSLLALGHLYIEKNLDTALQYLEQARSIFCKCYGDENSVMAEFLDSLGELYSEKGDLDTAKQYYEQAESIREILFGHNQET